MTDEDPGKSEWDAERMAKVARIAMRSETTASTIVKHNMPEITLVHKKTKKPTGATAKVDTWDIADCIKEQIELVKSGDMSGPEGMLVAQSISLDSMFSNFMRIAMECKKIEWFKIYADMALKAQRQSRANIETLGILKNPQPYIRQLNQAEQMQVNNGEKPSADTTRRREKKETTNELLEDHSNEWLDTGAAGATGGANSDMEAVGAIDRPQNG